ncbi:MAG: cobaltochelatase subunit CobN [Gammaproteobacteria bacterium]|nr:MAG: cobaltochelatase subunit CobN [Gammaproteobacteria bacterium]
MHLLAAKPGGFVDDEGIVDLDQTPAEIVILTAADSSLSALSFALNELYREDKTRSELPQVRLANWMQLLKPAAYDLYEHKVLDYAQVVIVSLLGGANYWAYGLDRLIEWQKRAKSDSPRTLIVVPGDDNPDPDLLAACSVRPQDAHRVWRYLREGGSENARHLYHFIMTRFIQGATSQSLPWQEPKPLPKCLIYQPGVEQGTLLAWRDKVRNQAGRDNPTVLLLFYRSHLQSANMPMFDRLIEILQRRQLSVLPVAISSLKEAASLTLVNTLIEQANVQLVLNATGFATNTLASPDLSSEPSCFTSPFEKTLVVLQLVLSGSTEQDWADHMQGLRSRDLAMQVVLPEMDGRIVTRALSFKSESAYDERTQSSIVQYKLHDERACFVAELARRYCQLATKPNAEKRIAMILANYPTKDGRIGNGVGLDTPESVCRLLTAMADAGYPVSDIPESGNGLIEALLSSVTNNPNTLHHLPCWQSLGMDTYKKLFATLPIASQKAVIDQWGQPEDDIKYRQGRLMISGIRLGETFVGIQPARGFNIDLVATYHDPDLIPPHHYLAFYFWLRYSYQVDAVIHVGKHGNLEWLPGKGTALSASCWPDIALGAMPHFYPFIVNDPGEGAQAKRRTQAAIIDHLMPPMTRAETYGPLAKLEALVDEYYQAMGMDDKREVYLRQAILKEIKNSHVLEELGTQDADNEETVLNELDAYLCDIKEAQIRHGLHILGTLPEADKLADTIVALLRLPRGGEDKSQGILHNLARDLNLKTNDALFEPLAASTDKWSGDKPAILAELDNGWWRTEADTRERLELLARQLVKAYVLYDWTDSLSDSSEGMNKASKELYEQSKRQLAQLPATLKQLDYTKTALLSALQESAELELASLIKGLQGERIDPGPSGAPTRGRLDTLPTGRNFFSVDNRAIPSPAAWQIGKASAQALVERHLQEHGDYPKQLGISVWGTATMRTGGDDIAQAFALMGVEPVWAPGSNRVVDFNVLSTQLLQRPRIDVTLRVSGFFRDAFPNVMKLFDAAVQAVIDIEEPGNENLIQQHVSRRIAELKKLGFNDAQARRQASYRVFGSKPGAYGAGLQGLIDERCWQQKSDLADAYLNWGGYAYGNESGDGVDARDAFRYRLSQLEVVSQNQDNREHDILDSDDYYQFQGGMSNAVEVFSGKAPRVYHNDHSNPASPKIRTLKEELNRVVRSRVLNPKWIHAMRQHGYKGAFEMGASIDYLFAYDATTNLIDDYQYEAVTDALLLDADNLNFLMENNPAVLEEMAERLLEAAQRGLWQSPGDYPEKLQDILLALDERQEQSP